ncbi:hypothetical protein [Mycoplasmopsis alligatoris]|uniref:hypothetical protein n=1 Tax=Mycoplasmopsis alligatoris TaxID=47687 RepID=UPI00145E760D|nr:hypothetical protein [Mycoplasmopsis alligatoris]
MIIKKNVIWTRSLLFSRVGSKWKIRIWTNIVLFDSNKFKNNRVSILFDKNYFIIWKWTRITTFIVTQLSTTVIVLLLHFLSSCLNISLNKASRYINPYTFFLSHH